MFYFRNLFLSHHRVNSDFRVSRIDYIVSSILVYVMYDAYDSYIHICVYVEVHRSTYNDRKREDDSKAADKGYLTSIVNTRARVGKRR